MLDIFEYQVHIPKYLINIYIKLKNDALFKTILYI